MNPRVVGVAALLGALFFLFSMNSRGPAEAPHQLSSQLYGELRSIQARWGSGGEATVLKEEVAGLHKRIADLERHATRSQEREKSAMVSNAERHAAPAASAFEPLCQVTFGRKLCMRGGQEEACPGAVDIDRRDGAVPTASTRIVSVLASSLQFAAKAAPAGWGEKARSSSTSAAESSPASSARPARSVGVEK